MSGMKFRRQCSSCNITFFTVERNANYCPKCRKKSIAVKVDKSPREIRSEEKKAVDASKVGNQSRPSDETTKGMRITKKTKAPKLSVLAEFNRADVKERVNSEYQQLKEVTLQLSKIHQQISNKLWVERRIVAEVVAEIRAEEVVASSAILNLSDDEKSRVSNRYLEMVKQGHRPTEGRRAAIARELGIDEKSVKLTVREWHDINIKPLTKEQLFKIEKEYLALLNSSKHSMGEICVVIARKLEFVNCDQVARWADFLNDDSKVGNVVIPSDYDRKPVKEAYRCYLSEGLPPERSLHYLLGEKFNLSPRQIYRILNEYRLQCKDLNHTQISAYEKEIWYFEPTLPKISQRESYKFEIE